MILPIIYIQMFLRTLRRIYIFRNDMKKEKQEPLKSPNVFFVYPE